MGKFNEISQNLKQSFGCNDIDINILDNKVVIDSTKKIIEVNNTLRANNIEINGVPSECFTQAEKEKLNKISTPMQVVGRVDSVELLPLTDVAIGSVYLVGPEGSSDFYEYIVISSNPTAYESLGKTQKPQVQVDWNKTTSTESDYILNKPAIKAGQGANAIIEGDLTQNIASGDYSHAEGYYTKASDYDSHAEGYSTKAIGTSSHAEGYYATASGYASHAEGNTTTASGSNSHAEGSYTTASGPASHAEGADTKASSTYSHAEGSNTTASGYASHAEGNATTANHKSQHVYGEYNIPDPSINLSYDRGNYIEIVGNGTDENTRSNARTLDWDGNETLTGTITANGINISEAISTVKFRVNSGSFQVSVDGGVTWHTINFAD